MKVTYSWIIYSCLIFGSSILCDRNLKKRLAVSSYLENIDDKFYCSNALSIKWSSVCDGQKHCSDGSDESKDLCARYEFGTNNSMDCGRVPEESKKVYLLEETPWIVDIYKVSKNSDVYNHIGLGSIISQNVVVAGAQIFWRYGIRHKQNSIDGYSRHLFKIDIPLQTLTKNDHHYIDVKMIYLHDEATEFKVSFEDIAVIVLEKKISFSNGVTPVCIDWYNQFHILRNGINGKIAGIKKQAQLNRTLLQRYFQQIKNIGSCMKRNDDESNSLIFSARFCNRLKLGKSEVDGSDFQSFSFLYSNSYFLTGITSFSNLNFDDTDLDFISIEHYFPWIRGILNKHSTADSCVIPTVEGVVHSFEGSHSILSPGTLINPNTTVIENCEVGYHDVYPNRFRVCQENGKWKPSINKLCLKMCPPLISYSLDIKCSYNGKDANCSNRSIPDTIAKARCKPAYDVPNGKIETPLELHCQSNGMWNNDLYKCEPNCGRPFVEAKILINNGKTANVGMAPWNVAIYKKISDYEFLCGGSVISRNLVVSAAHCFWEKGMPHTIIIFDGLYKIAIGKYYKNITIYENEDPQIMNVDRIHMKEGYNGLRGYHADDLAVVVLKNSVAFQNGITPICIDWHQKYIVSNGDKGQIVGWGNTGKGIESPILLRTDLPYINLTTCREICTQREFDSYVTPDKFCAGSTSVSGHGVDGGDSGGGLCFSYSKLYYLTGVVSLKEKLANNSVALFTSVGYHIRWIKELYIYYKNIQYD